METKTTIDNAHFNLALEIAKFCFAPVPRKDDLRRVQRIRRRFANNSKLLKMLCDCTSTISYKGLKTAILLYNKDSKDQFNKFVNKHHNYKLITKNNKIQLNRILKNNYASNVNKSIQRTKGI